MPNRYIDTGFYKSPFVRGLKGSLKSLYSFIICDCSGSGIWTKDLQIASAYIDFNVTEKDFEIFIKTGKAIDLKNGRYFFPDFIEHQYPKGLSANNPAHNNFILELKKYQLIDENLKVLKSPLEGTHVMVNVMVEEKVNVTVSDPKKKELIFPYESERFKKVWAELILLKKWRKKEHSALQASLLKLSKHSESDAIEMMLNTIAGDYQGLFEIDNKNKKNGNDTTKNQHPLAEVHRKSEEILGQHDTSMFE